MLYLLVQNRQVISPFQRSFDQNTYGTTRKTYKKSQWFKEGYSCFNDGVDPAELLGSVHSGKYSVAGAGVRGNPIVDFVRLIGVDGRTGQLVTRGQIHYGKKWCPRFSRCEELRYYFLHNYPIGSSHVFGLRSLAAGREVNFMIYDSAATGASRDPSVVLPK